MPKLYDLIIVGAGPAGVTAAVYAARKRMDFIVISGDVGGQAIWSGDIENYTGYQFITGTELVEKFEEHIKTYNVPLLEGEKVNTIETSKTGSLINIQAESGKSFQAKTLIIASGKRSRMLNVPGEKEFLKKGVTYCATCDAPLFHEKNVAVIGGGNSGLEAVLQLTVIARKVYLINIMSDLTGDTILQEKVRASNKVEVLNNTTVIRIFGETFVKGISLQTQKRNYDISVDGVFIEIGLIPNSEFTKDITTNKQGEIIVNNRNETNIPGIFAAGDVTDVPEKQIIIAAGEGSKACLSAYSYLIYRES